MYEEAKPTISFKRKPFVLDRTGFSRSTLYNRINEGLFPPPIQIGGRAVAWLSYEIDEIIVAMVSCVSREELKLTVNNLMQLRKKLSSSASLNIKRVG